MSANYATLFLSAIALFTPMLVAAAPVDNPSLATTQPASGQALAPLPTSIFDDLDQFHRIVILCEGGGTMIPDAIALKMELKKAVASLAPDQSFNIVFFKEKDLDPVGKVLIPATPENQRKAGTFLDRLTTTGDINPIPGLVEAFREKPEVIYLLDNGDYGRDDEAIANKIKALNKDGKTKIYTIVFTHRPDVDEDAVTFFKKVASDGGGKFKHISTDDLEEPAVLSPMFDDLGHFHRIVIVSDASGSMSCKMATLKDQLNKAVVALKPEQSFGLIFMQDKACDCFNDKLVPAIATQKRAAGQFLENAIMTHETNPIPAIEKAFKLNPDAIYLITDGDFPDNNAVLNKIRDLNAEGKVRIYTIAFVVQTDNDSAFIDMFKTIAPETGGKYKHVNEGDL